ncbi:hypothetical protein [Streptomyces sp. NPDC048577]|uniref:hypothetical protein n=1 Tax=Streptomyces sp. NPDC048577 TaxID=3157209 RepID=UPI003425F1B6
MRIVEAPDYMDVSLTVYMKVKALGARIEGCTAAVATLALYLSLSVATINRGLAQLRKPAADGIVEIAENNRRTLPCGTGTTARRRVRAMRRAERYVWLPLAAAERLKPRELRAYAVIVYAVIQKIPLTEAGLAQYLRHHTGLRAGLPLSAESASRIVEVLAEGGWITVNRRSGANGRHIFGISDKWLTAEPVAPVLPVTVAPVSPVVPVVTVSPVVPVVTVSPVVPVVTVSPVVPVDFAPRTSQVDETSGSHISETSLAYKEDLRIDRPGNEGASFSPAVGEVPVVKGAHSCVADSGDQAATRDFALRADDTPRPSLSTRFDPDPSAKPSPKPNRTTFPSPKAPYPGPQLTFSPRLHTILEPVRFLLGRVNTYVLRRIGRELSRQLGEGSDARRLQARLDQRLAQTLVSDIRDPGRWLLAVALPRWGCANPDCESGTLWSTGARCTACAEIVALRASARRACPDDRPPADEPALATRATASDHTRSVTPGPVCCPDCDFSPDPRHPQATDIPNGSCQGRDGTCGRPAQHGLCWRCRLESETHASQGRTAGGPAEDGTP